MGMHVIALIKRSSSATSAPTDWVRRTEEVKVTSRQGMQATVAAACRRNEGSRGRVVVVEVHLKIEVESI